MVVFWAVVALLVVGAVAGAGRTGPRGASAPPRRSDRFDPGRADLDRLEDDSYEDYRRYRHRQ